MDIINIKILDDGTIEMKTSEISIGNHISADQLVAEMEKMMGGLVDIKPNKEAGVHNHNHQQAFVGGHSHDGGKTFHH
jgi:hypothetical protein